MVRHKMNPNEMRNVKMRKGKAKKIKTKLEFSLTYKIHTKQIQTNTYIHVHIRHFHIVCYVEIWKKNHHLYSNTNTTNGNDTNIIPAVYALYTFERKSIHSQKLYMKIYVIFFAR